MYVFDQFGLIKRQSMRLAETSLIQNEDEHDWTEDNLIFICYVNQVSILLTQEKNEEYF